MYLSLIPAYGRTYASRKAALADWEAGKDFKPTGLAAQQCGTYCSVRNAQALRDRGFTHLELRSGHVADRVLAVVKL